MASAVSGVDPEIMGVGPIQAVKRVLGHAGMTMGDIDAMELNEAFAAQVIPVCREVGIDPSTTGSTRTAARSRSAIPTA